MDRTLNDLVGVLFEDSRNKGDKSYYGVIDSVITEDDKVVGYNVIVGDSTIEARKLAGADVGDTVLCTNLSNGQVVITGALNGDKDALLAQEVADTAQQVAELAEDMADLARQVADNTAQDLADNYSTTEEVAVMIGELGGGSYRVVEYAMSSSSSTKPTSGWSEKIPNLTSSQPYLWMRYVIVEGDTRTVVTGSESVSTLMSGAYTFMANNYDYAGAANDAVSDLEYYMRYGYTTINGGCITTGYIQSSLIVGNDLRLSGSTADTGSFSITSSNTGLYLGYNFFLLTLSGYDEVELSTSGLFFEDDQEIWMDGDIAAGFIYGSGLCGGYEGYTTTTTSAVNGRVKTASPEGCVVRHSDSSRRWKRNIEPVHDSSLDPHKLYDLPVSQFIYKNGYLTGEDDRLGELIVGFIAEDVEEYYPAACDYGADGLPESWNDLMIIPPMLKLIQEQNDRITELEERLNG